MQFKFALLALAPVAHGLGINCRGSSNCGPLGSAGHSLSWIFDTVNANLDMNRRYSNGQKIACSEARLGSSGICAFLQNLPAGETYGGQRLKDRLRELRDHGCTVCGSVPTRFPEVNDVAFGQITVNAVTNTDGCHGMC